MDRARQPRHTRRHTEPARNRRRRGAPRPTTSARSGSRLFGGQERGIAARGRGVDGGYLFAGEAPEVVRTACLRPGAGEPDAAERLRADHRPDHAAIDVNIAVGEPRHDLLDGGIDAGMDAEREAVAVGGNLLEQRVKLPGTPAHDVQDRSEYLFA